MKSTNYVVYKFEAAEEQQDILIALLSNLNFDSFEQTQSGVEGYILEDNITDQLKSAIEENLHSFYTNYNVESLPNKNWNEEWESSFQPIVIGNFCGIRASFHKPLSNLTHEVIIDPKMAFGTGHHATTWMMISHMKLLQISNASVLDFGAGTGILAILAAQMGASQIEAVEIDHVAVENCMYNLSINKIRNVQCYTGGIEQVPNQQYDIILANINRNVILDTLSLLVLKMETNGKILFSGILAEDETLVLENFKGNGLHFEKKMEKDGWISILLSN